MSATCADIEGTALKHATAPALDRLDPLLVELRSITGLREKSRGVFYRKSSAFLHFHEDPAGLFADIRGTTGEFDRLRVETAGEQAVLARLAQSRVSPAADRLVSKVVGRLPDGWAPPGRHSVDRR